MKTVKRWTTESKLELQACFGVEIVQEITNYRKPFPHIAVNCEMADDLNVLYCRFEKPTFTPITHSSIKQPSSPPAAPQPSLLTPHHHSGSVKCQLFRQQKTRKAPGPDGVSP